MKQPKKLIETKTPTQKSTNIARNSKKSGKAQKEATG
jgi:hypothetical protein